MTFFNQVIVRKGMQEFVGGTPVGTVRPSQACFEHHDAGLDVSDGPAELVDVEYWGNHGAVRAVELSRPGLSSLVHMSRRSGSGTHADHEGVVAVFRDLPPEISIIAEHPEIEFHTSL